MAIQVCNNISMIPHIPRLSVVQLQVLLILKKLDCATTIILSDVLGYEPNETAKILSYIRHSLSDRPQLVKGESIGKGRGNPQMWSLTDYGRDIITQYLESISMA